MPEKTIRIGTRDSELALWQATTVKNQLEKLGYATELIPIKSSGDLNVSQPLYEMGITGIFTKTLDLTMLNGKIDVAVHSMKDVPTALPNGIVEAAVFPRGNSHDILVHNGTDFLANNKASVVATGSLRRKAQWLHKYPHHHITNLRGNVNTRLQKLKDNNWNGAIFAAAGLERIGIKPENCLDLDWMIPAPAQGAMLAVALANDPYSQTALAQLNHTETQICVTIEREFLKTLEGGCTAPIGALATIKNERLFFSGALFSLDGKTKISVEKTQDLKQLEGFGKSCAEEILQQGGTALMKTIKAQLA